MQSAVEKLEVEVMQQMTNNAALKQHLDQLRNALVSNLSHLPLPGNEFLLNLKCSYPQD